jgi:uncharacterized membrane-anchored protein
MMTTSIFLAKLVGPCLVVIATSMIVNAQTFQGMAQQFTSNPALIYFVGHIALPAGLATVLTHNVWVVGWPVLITILGWLAMIGGAMRIIMPQRAARIGNKFSAKPATIATIGVLWLAIGAVLSFFGYVKQ